MAPAIADGERRARPDGTPLAMLTLIDAARFGKDRVRPAWEVMALPAKREVIAKEYRTEDQVILHVDTWSPYAGSPAASGSSRPLP